MSRLRALPIGLVLAASLLLNVWGISFGLPTRNRAWDQDEILPRHVLATMERGFASQAWLVKYPPFQYYLLAPVYRAVIALETGGVLSRGPMGRYTRLFYVSRAINVLLGTLTVLFVYLAARQALDRTAATLAAATYAVVLPAVYYAKLANLDVPYVFWFSVSLWLYLRMLAHQRLRDYVGFGLAAAMAVGTKDQAYGLYLLAPFPALLALRQNDRALGRARSLLATALDRRLLACAAAGGLLFALGHQIPFRPALFETHVDKITGPYSASFRWFERSLAGQIANLRLCAVNTWFALGPGPTVASLAGILLVPWRRDPRQALLLGASLTLALSYYVTFLCVLLYNYERYFMPVCLVLAIFAGVALARIARARRIPAPLRVGAVVLVLGQGALRAVAMDLEMVNDSRYAVERFLAIAGDPGDAMALGDPLRGPRVPTTRWLAFHRTQGKVATRSRPRFLVLNLTDAVSQDVSRPWLPRLEGGEMGYDVRFRPRYRPRADFFDPDGTTGSLFFVNPSLVVLERRDDRWLERWASVSGRALSPALTAAARHRGRRAFEEAHRLDEAARARSPSDPLAAIALALDLTALGRPEEAEALLARTPREDLGTAAAIDGARARALLAAGRADEAFAPATASAAAAPGSADTWLTLADAAHASGRTALAIDALDRAARLAASAGDRRVLDEIAWRLADRGAGERAARVALSAATSGGPPEEWTLHSLARLLRAVGRPDAAAVATTSAYGPRTIPPSPSAAGMRAGNQPMHALEREPSGPRAPTMPPADLLERTPRVLPLDAWSTEAHGASGGSGLTGACALARIERPDSAASSLRIVYACPAGDEHLASGSRLEVPGLTSIALACGAAGTSEVEVQLPGSLWGGSAFLPVAIVTAAHAAADDLEAGGAGPTAGIELHRVEVRWVGDASPR